jgi:NTP pyrophosphatase (non-canonical NTP hydrolase)
MEFEELQENILEWANERHLLNINNAPKQALKITEELGETLGAFLKGNQQEIQDGIGDILVTVIIFAQQLNYDPVKCLELAWDEIKDRKGKTVDGTFIKD